MVDGGVDLSEHDLRLDVELEHAFDGAGPRDHAASSSARAATVAACRAAESGRWPEARDQTYAARNASPAPVGSAVSTRRTGTCSRTPPAISVAPVEPRVSRSSGMPCARDRFLAAERLELLLVQLQHGQRAAASRRRSRRRARAARRRRAGRAPARRARAGGRARARRAPRRGKSARVSAPTCTHSARPTSRTSSSVQGVPGSAIVISRSSPA